jgi:hypothetical protein
VEEQIGLGHGRILPTSTIYGSVTDYGNGRPAGWGHGDPTADPNGAHHSWRT